MRSESCRPQPTRSARPPSFQNRGIAALLPIVAVLILLPTIAFANPPDPSWITATYDDADGDDSVFPDYQPIAAVAVSQQPFLSPPYLSRARSRHISGGGYVSSAGAIPSTGRLPLAQGRAADGVR